MPRSSKGLGRRVFSPKIRVQFPVEVPIMKTDKENTGMALSITQWGTILDALLFMSSTNCCGTYSVEEQERAMNLAFELTNKLGIRPENVKYYDVIPEIGEEFSGKIKEVYPEIVDRLK